LPPLEQSNVAPWSGPRTMVSDGVQAFVTDSCGPVDRGAASHAVIHETQVATATARVSRTRIRRITALSSRSLIAVSREGTSPGVGRARRVPHWTTRPGGTQHMRHACVSRPRETITTNPDLDWSRRGVRRPARPYHNATRDVPIGSSVRQPRCATRALASELPIGAREVTR
jgi:hypothetical protein